MPASPAIDITFSALGDPTRRAIVERLASGDATVLELAAPFDISLPAISRHLKVLEEAGLITRGRDAQRRPCRLRPEALREVTVWAEHTRRAWEERFERLDEYLRELQATAKTEKKKTRKEKDHGKRKKQ
ncbi:MAG: ArsR/SmtB family transcription factor [Polyangiaceae bacterium]